MRTRFGLFVISIAFAAAPACGDDGGSNTIDSGFLLDAPSAVDAPPSADAPPMIDAPPPSDAAACAADLAPIDDGTLVPADLVIAEIDPGDFIELYNATDQPIALGSIQHQLCSPFQYAALSSLAPNVVIAPAGRAVIPWPSSFADTDSGGEVILYKDAFFNDDDGILDFICWGSNPHGTRKSQAEFIGKWQDSADCAGAITGGSIHRLPNSNGTTAASYDVESAPSAETCE